MKRSTELPSELTVSAWMNNPEHWVVPEAYVEEAFAIMRRAGIRHLLVMKNDELLGVVTDRDLRRPNGVGEELVSVREMYLFGDNLRVADVMTEEPVTIGPDTLTAEAARVMVENKFDCLPVLKGEKVVGIITSSDLLAALVYEVDPDFVAARELEAS